MRLLEHARSVEDRAWRELMEVLWPELLRLARASRAMTALAASDDHLRNVVLLVFEKLGKDGCRAARLHLPWLDAHPGKTLRDWLRIVTANVARDYVRATTGRGEARGALPIDKRLLSSLATLLPDDDELRPVGMLSATSSLAAMELARHAEEHLPPEQTTALRAWLGGASFDEVAAALGAADEAAAKRTLRAAIAALRRYASAA